MAKKKASKSDFIRSLPSELTTDEVIAKAKEAGLTVSKGLIYVVRTGWKAKKKSQTKTAASDSKLSAADFIRAQPSSVSAKQVVEAGAKNGHSFKTSYVYALRAKAPAKAAPARRGRPPKATVQHSAPASREHGGASPSLKETMRNLILAIGSSGVHSLADEVVRELKSGHA